MFRIPEPPLIILSENGDYALGLFRRSDESLQVTIYKAKGRPTKHGRRRIPVANLTIIEEK